MSKVAGYRCPTCGDNVLTIPMLNDNVVICADMGHWMGTIEECTKVHKPKFYFEKWLEENRNRFRCGHFNEDEIAYSAFLTGIDYSTKDS